jgi:hypothetical protein
MSLLYCRSRIVTQRRLVCHSAWYAPAPARTSTITLLPRVTRRASCFLLLCRPTDRLDRLLTPKLMQESGRDVEQSTYRIALSLMFYCVEVLLERDGANEACNSTGPIRANYSDVHSTSHLTRMILQMIALQLDELLEPKPAQGHASSRVLPAGPREVLVHTKSAECAYEKDASKWYLPRWGSRIC